MLRAIRSIFCKILILIIFFLSSFSAMSQPPVELPDPAEISGQIDPKTLSQPQLRALLADKNQEVGKDKNAELYKNNKIEKDSVVVDDIRSSAYSPSKTYGANVVSNSGLFCPSPVLCYCNVE